MENPDQTENLAAGAATSKRELRKARFEEAIRKEKRKSRLWITAIIAGVILCIAGIMWALIARNKNLPGELYPNQGQSHVELNKEFTYNSNPPTSGPHFPSPASWGTYDYEANDKFFIHNLEHGGIWISYRPSVPASVVSDLKGIINEFSGSKIVMTPRSANDTDVAIAAWTRLLKFNLENGTLSAKQKDEIRSFYRALKNHGPEFVPDEMPGIDPKSVK